MGDAGHQVAADLVFAVECIGHLVEGRGQVAQLARGPDLARPRGAVAARHGPGHRDQRRDRAGDPPRHRQAGQQGQQRGQPGRAGDGPQQRGPQQGVGGTEAGSGEPDQGRAQVLAAHHDGGA